MKRFAGGILAFVAVVALAIQLVPVDRTNPPVEGRVAMPAPVHSILSRSCLDCHSNETIWPWYSQVAPLSWQIARDVQNGRAALNFSTWDRLSAEAQAEAWGAVDEEINEGEMPPKLYTLAHPDARLSSADRNELRAWLQSNTPALDASEEDERFDD
jgi:hypothetical protein